jgi:hypothetical protein
MPVARASAAIGYKLCPLSPSRRGGKLIGFQYLYLFGFNRRQFRYRRHVAG